MTLPLAAMWLDADAVGRMGRRFIGIELKRSYYEQACRNLTAASKETAPLFA